MAIAVKPHKKKMNIQVKYVFDLAGAWVNSRQTKDAPAR